MPVSTVKEAARHIAPSFVVLTGVTPERARPVDRQLRALARAHPLAVGGRAAADDDINGGVVALRADSIEEATRLTALIADRSPA